MIEPIIALPFGKGHAEIVLRAHSTPKRNSSFPVTPMHMAGIFGTMLRESAPVLLWFHMGRGRKNLGNRWLRFILSGLLLVCSLGSYALNPELDVSQYAHTVWRVRDGFTRGAIVAIAQTPDGYLWLGTEFGLYRFDGVRAIPWHSPAGADLASEIYCLLVARDGTLWIGTQDGAASW